MLALKRPWTDALGRPTSDEAKLLSNNIEAAVEALYADVAGSQVANVIKLQPAAFDTETLAFVDLGSSKNADAKALKAAMEKKLSQGRLGDGLDVKEPGDNWWRIISGPGS